MRVLTVENTRNVERIATGRGISYLQLMENAGSYCARIIRQTFDNTNKRNVLIVCGKGKNGGDGFVIARKLLEFGYYPTVMMAMGFPTDEESSEMLSRIRASGITIVYFDETTDRFFQNAQIIVDCIFGIGFKGEVNDNISRLFQKINNASASVVSIDVPSGLEGDNGKLKNSYVRADMTIAILSLKPVHILKPAVEVCGKVVVAPLVGISEQCFEQVDDTLFIVNEDELKSFFKNRDYDSHKGTYGTVLVIGGSYEMPNAVCLASRAAVNSGAGLVKIAFPEIAYNAIAPKTCEQVLIPLESNKKGRISRNAIKQLELELVKCSCILVGCGMGDDEETRTIVEYIIKNSKVPIIIDADGINCLKDNIDIIDSAKVPIILTPHPKEMSRITGVSVAEIQENRSATVKSFTRAHKSILVLKGVSTLVASSEYGDIYINDTGNPGMATGGTGDILGGIIASFIAQGMEVFRSAIAGVKIHGMVGDKVSEKYSMMGNTPTLMLDELPSLLSKFE